MHTWARALLLVNTPNFEGLGFHMLHFVLDDGVYSELALGHTGNLRVMHGGPHEVLVDIGLLSGVTFSKHVPSRSELRQRSGAWAEVVLVRPSSIPQATSARAFGHRRERARSSARAVCELARAGGC